MKDAAREQILKKLGRILAKKRKTAGLTQSDVGKRLGVGDEQVYRIEGGITDPGIYKLHVMAKLFDCGIETLLVESSNRPDDQTAHMLKMMEKLSPANRRLVVEIVEKLTSELGKSTRTRAAKIKKSTPSALQ